MKYEIPKMLILLCETADVIRTSVDESPGPGDWTGDGTDF